ncbi:hypothetical protein QBC38DRAFT_517386 [Podospora fimiseda]|uniref:Uncharacterized protein n=1 Tax=Podospora fimiseda TaxID=252190 RepID=A0AAN7GNI2_9PEZI|nr:hypothetical protein QBC38DRAFT_517386 [Podospora fimiseda]
MRPTTSLTSWLATIIFLLLSSINLTVAPAPPGPYKYWFNATCLAKDKRFQDYFDEMTFRAGSVSKKLKDPTDTDFHRVFHIIFKTKVDDEDNFFEMTEEADAWAGHDTVPMTGKDMVTEAMDALSVTWQYTSAREEANLRVYCDDLYVGAGSRYRPTISGQKLYDTVNDFYFELGEDAGGQHDCEAEDPSLAITGEVVNGRRQNSNVDWFVVMDLCQEMWINLMKVDERYGLRAPRSVKEMDQDRGGNGHLHGMAVVHAARQWPLLTLFHEWLHVPPFLGEDYPEPLTGETSGWEHVMGLTAKEAFHSPEAYTFLALWAALADLPAMEGRGGYTISRDWDNIDDEYKWTNSPGLRHGGHLQNEGYEGYAMAYRDLTGTRNLRDEQTREGEKISRSEDDL